VARNIRVDFAGSGSSVAPSSLPSIEPPVHALPTARHNQRQGPKRRRRCREECVRGGGRAPELCEGERVERGEAGALCVVGAASGEAEAEGSVAVIGALKSSGRKGGRQVLCAWHSRAASLRAGKKAVRSGRAVVYSERESGVLMEEELPTQPRPGGSGTRRVLPTQHHKRVAGRRAVHEEMV